MVRFCVLQNLHKQLEEAIQDGEIWVMQLKDTEYELESSRERVQQQATEILHKASKMCFYLLFTATVYSAVSVKFCYSTALLQLSKNLQIQQKSYPPAIPVAVGCRCSKCESTCLSSSYQITQKIKWKRHTACGFHLLPRETTAVADCKLTQTRVSRSSMHVATILKGITSCTWGHIP